MRLRKNLNTGASIALVTVVALSGCGQVKQNASSEPGKVRAEAKRRQLACASPAAYDRIKGILFDRAIDQHSGDRSNLQTLADYSLVRMEEPVVRGWDPALDITKCTSRLVLVVPPGAEQAFAGERQLRADIEYTAQAAADGRGFVYQVKGAEPIVEKLAGFNLTSQRFRPPPAIDEAVDAPEVPDSAMIDRAKVLPPTRRATERPSMPAVAVAPAPRRALPQEPRADLPEPSARPPIAAGAAAGEDTVRSFYTALGSGDGVAASAHVVPEKRSSRAFSPEAISRFYGRLPEPIRLTGIVPLAAGLYRVNYRYSAGRSHCNGSAVVSLTRRDGRDLIRSIRALKGC